MNKNMLGNNTIIGIVILLAIIISYILYKKYLGKTDDTTEGMTGREWRKIVKKIKDNLEKDITNKDEWISVLNIINRDLNLQMLKTLQDLMAEKSINVNGTNYIKLEKYKNLNDIVTSLEDYITNDYVSKDKILNQ